ncbi:MAG TPA: UDP-N-acetylmuramoyl-tripeptide--D-alanyl-D-alanine ligase [Gaiellaceae bacterium]|nr:UDP-N-acetylmuramoyl-tripeptide--D-alanyl-D-alanine ligase [Gaiellaceae bacterium]
MIPLPLSEIEEIAPGRLVRAPGVERALGVTIDSRRTAPGDLFVAVGAGREYVEDALAAGAAAALVPEDAFGALGALGHAVRSRSSARVVAVTGSTAKTSTKDILGALCSPHARTVVAEGSQNNEIGLPLTLCRLEQETEVVIVEMGMRGLGQIADLCEIARPDVGVVTSVGPVHLELLGTVERVAQAKAELIESLPPGGTAVVPAGEVYLDPYLARDDLRVFRFGEGGDVSLSYFAAHDGSARIRVEAFGRPLTLEFSFSSRYNATNALAALAAYHALGLPLGKAQKGARHVQLSRLRGEEVALPGGGVLLNDCYNANPLSMTAALEHLEERAAGHRRVAVLGDMAELGPGAPTFHREVGAVAARAGVEVLVAVGPLARNYVQGARGVPVTRWAPTVEQGLAVLRSVLEPGDCVLVKGSRAMGLEVIAEAVAVVPARA